MRWGGFGVNKLYDTSNINNICMHTLHLDKKQRQKYKVIGHYRVKLTFTLGPAPAGVVWAGQEAAAGGDPVLGVGVGGVHPDLTVAAWWGGVTLCCPHCSAGGHSVLPSLYYITLEAGLGAASAGWWRLDAGMLDPGLVTAGLASPGLQHGSSQLAPLHLTINLPLAHVPSFPPTLQVLAAPAGQGRRAYFRVQKIFGTLTKTSE